MTASPTLALALAPTCIAGRMVFSGLGLGLGLGVGVGVGLRLSLGLGCGPHPDPNPNPNPNPGPDLHRGPHGVLMEASEQPRALPARRKCEGLKQWQSPGSAGGAPTRRPERRRRSASVRRAAWHLVRRPGGQAVAASAAQAANQRQLSTLGPACHLRGDCSPGEG